MCNFVECVWLFCFSFFLFGMIGFFVVSLKFGLYLFGMIGRFGGKFGFFVVFWNKCFVMWFFKEWNVIMLILLFGFNKVKVFLSEFFIVLSLLLMVIWMVWKVCFFGCLFFFFVGVGIVVLIIFISLFVVLIGFILWWCLILWVICFENFFLLYWKKIWIKFW